MQIKNAEKIEEKLHYFNERVTNIGIAMELGFEEMAEMGSKLIERLR